MIVNSLIVRAKTDIRLLNLGMLPEKFLIRRRVKYYGTCLAAFLITSKINLTSDIQKRKN